MMMDEGTDPLKVASRDNYARLAQIKERYDSGNLFHALLAPLDEVSYGSRGFQGQFRVASSRAWLHA